MKIDNIKSVIPIDKIYEDALSPAMKQIGKSLESVAKTSRFLLAPFDYLAAQHDRWERYLKKVSEKVKAEDLMEGHPQIVIPTLEGLSLTYENTLLSELFINLLANSIDKTKQDFAHPAFPNIIKQLSHDEAVILFYLKKKNYVIKQHSAYDNGRNWFAELTTVEDEFPVDKLQFSSHMSLYMNHLNSLNIAGTYEIGDQESIYEPETKKQIGVYINSERKLAEFGLLFVNSCVPDDFEVL
ncbi:Abi-alpha family protein [Pedobacter sp. WC2423]|uniref:Abi-alpha family protein n=1 Tax=Pedobacter sp. WC2423 TaxID=3234142 RepID=UPI003465CB5E